MQRKKAKKLKRISGSTSTSFEARPDNLKTDNLVTSLKSLNKKKLNELIELRPTKPTIQESLKPKTSQISISESAEVEKSDDENDTNDSDELDYHVIGSGSSGNCVRIENVMIDIGLPYKHIKEDLYKTDVILITHTHYDHIKSSVYNRIRKEFPDIKIVGNHQVATEYDVDFICYEGTPFSIKGIDFTPFLGKHNVLCYGYIWKAKGYDIIYCTDSSDFDNSPSEQKYDYLFLESNHSQKKLAAIQKPNMYRKYGYNAYEAGIRHCSTERCLAFYYEHRKSRDSVLIELHKSERFY